jgi:S1-C subfamily serine protease
LLALWEIGYRLKGSLGKSILGLSVVMHSRWQFYLRETAGKIISTATFGIGFLLALGKEETTFHDLIAKTSVVPASSRAPVERRIQATALLTMAALAGFVWAGSGSWTHSPNEPLARTDRPLDAVTSQTPAVLTINCYDSGNQRNVQGSGFLISSDGVAVTNFHVIDGAFRAEAQLGDGRLYQVTAVRAFDRDLDVAVLQLGRNFGRESLNVRGLPFVQTGESADLRVGDRVATISSPEGLANTVTDGLVSAIRTDGDRTLLQISAPISPGSSGSPVFTLDGKAIGISVAQYVKGQNLNFAIPIETVVAIRRHETSLSFDEFRLLSGEQAKEERNNSSAETSADTRQTTEQSALSGFYWGLVRNTTVDKSANFGIVSEERNGSIRGCMGVTVPLYGSGPFDGAQDGSHVQFTVRHAETQLTFDGAIHNRQVSGSYTVSSPGAATQYGTFLLERQDAASEISGDCPTDAEMNKQN